jgi:hypothetical protein
MIPISKFRRMVNANVGATGGFEGGYRWYLADGVALSVLGNPQFSVWDTQSSCCSDEQNDSETGSMFSITGGPKLSFDVDPVELYTFIKGGYYRDMSGPIQDDGVGFNAGGGVGFEVAENTTLGLFARYEYANMVAAKNSDVNRQWVLSGFQLTHVFAEEPPPPPAPPPTGHAP